MQIMKLIPTLLFAITGALGLASCDNVDENERFNGPISLSSAKNVLIEDFTGQRCVNCPLAAYFIEQYKETYGSERIIAVSIHGGANSLSEETNPAQGLANEQGTAYNQHWGVTTKPSGLIDRAPGVGVIDYRLWQAEVAKRFQQDLKANISVKSTTYNPADRKLNIELELKGMAEESVAGKVQVWLTENNLQREQDMPDGTRNNEYIHQHVFRASVNDPFGDPQTISHEETRALTFQYTLKEHWVPENMAVVAFFYNETDGVIQATESHILPEAN